MTDDKGTIRDLRKTINELLDLRRPDRYTIGGITEDGQSETKFLTDTAAEIESLIPEASAVKRFAQELVNEEEAKSTQRANKVWKDYYLTGQRPLFLDGIRAWPMSVVSVDPNDKTKRITERVALRAVTDDDGEAFANEERRRAGRDFSARNATCEGIELIVARTREAGMTLILDYLATEEPPETEALS
jgi:hypothetical protein